MRGAPEAHRLYVRPDGIIPADAGSTCPLNRSCAWKRDHPRGCGEHWTAWHCVVPSGGSSPRMRGALYRVLGLIGKVWIIPADAGSTIHEVILPYRFGDHPRGCGEHVLLRHSRNDRRGSSPRMRGALVPDRRLVVQQRIIPADAGSTRRSLAQRSSGWDHPRGCGEHRMVLNVVLKQKGSSPRMRGAQRMDARFSRASRIIPADAGSTLVCYFCNCLTRDHPRGCGEHSST